MGPPQKSEKVTVLRLSSVKICKLYLTLDPVTKISATLHLPMIGGDEVNMYKHTIACPKCGSTGTFTIGVLNGAGNGQCKSCHKSVRIEVRNGDIIKTS